MLSVFESLDLRLRGDDIILWILLVLYASGLLPENCSAFCLAFQCEKESRILANKNELKADGFLKNKNLPKQPITAIKRAV